VAGIPKELLFLRTFLRFHLPCALRPHLL